MKGIGIISRQITAILIVSAFGSICNLNAASDTIYLNYDAVVAEECSLTVPASDNSLSFGNLGEESPAKALSIDVLINCNAPFRYTIQSQNAGALKVSNPPVVSSVSDAFDKQIEYSVTFISELEDGDLAAINRSCREELSDRQNNLCSGTSGSSIAINKAAKLDVVLDSTLDKVFLAGTYVDQITISITTEL